MATATRSLDYSDRYSLYSLIDSRSQFVGLTDPDHIAQHQKFAKGRAKDLLDCGPTVGRIFGTWDGNLLVGAVFCILSKAQPCYFINQAYTRPSAKLSTLARTWAFLISWYEIQGYNRFYTVYKSTDIEKYHRLWQTQKVLQSYISYTDLVVPTNTRVKQSDYWEYLFGRMLFPQDMAVRGFIRKQGVGYYDWSQ